MCAYQSIHSLTHECDIQEYNKRGLENKPFFNYNWPGELQKPGHKKDSCEFRFRCDWTIRMHGTKLLNPMKKAFLMILAGRIWYQIQGSIKGKWRLKLL